jgi:hypothetical protein
LKNRLSGFVRSGHRLALGHVREGVGDVEPSPATRKNDHPQVSNIKNYQFKEYEGAIWGV